MVSIDETGHLYTSEDKNKNWYAHLQGKLDRNTRAVYRETTKSDKDYQLWNVVYADEMKQQGCKEGQYDQAGGMPCNVEFQIVSASNKLAL